MNWCHLAMLSIMLIAMGCQGQPCTIASGMGDVTDRVIPLGNLPKKENFTARDRNPWDLQVYNSKIFIGFGNTTTNPGPVALYAYNPVSAAFEKTITVDAEAIERLRDIDQTLYVPNSDPTSGNSFKYDYYDGSSWLDVDAPHSLAHVRDMYLYNGYFYLVGNSLCPDNKTAACAGIIRHIHPDSTFENDIIEEALMQAGGYTNPRWNWFFGLLEYQGQLIVPNAMFTLTYHPSLIIEDAQFFLINTDTVQWSAFMPDSLKLKHHHFYPVDTTVTGPHPDSTRIALRPFAHAEIDGKLIYTLRTYSHYDDLYTASYNNSAGIVIKDSLYGTAQFIILPEAEAIGEDLLVDSGDVYVLANQKIQADSHTVFVYKSPAPSAMAVDWEEVLHFSSGNKARSFEYHDGIFYIGLGSDHLDSIGQSGLLVKVHACDSPSCPPAGQACDDNNPCTIDDATDGYCGCFGTNLDTDMDGICDYYDDCPKTISIGGIQQFDRSFDAAQTTNINALVNLNTTLKIYADSIRLLPNLHVTLGSSLEIDTTNCF